MTGNPGDPRMRFRLWIEGKLHDDVWLDCGNPEADAIFHAVKLRHTAAVESATRAGQPWMIEVYDPELPEEQAYFRWGTDAAGMVEPRATQAGKVRGVVMDAWKRSTDERNRG